jgi:choline dehydrogenase-like flavoprotein
MGENKNNSITNSFGKVHDFEGLYINDSSLLPTAPTVNPQGTLMMIARRNINHYLSSGN